MGPPLSVRLALSSYRALTRLLPRRDCAHREETLLLARTLLTKAWEQGGLAELPSRRGRRCSPQATFNLAAYPGPMFKVRVPAGEQDDTRS